MSEVISITMGFSNLYIIRGSRVIIVDTGTNVTKEKYEELFALHKIDPCLVSLLVITHGHYDHFAGAAILKELTKAPVLCHRNAAKLLESGENAPVIPCNELGESMHKLLGKKLYTTVKGVIPDILMDDDFSLVPFGVMGKAVPTPGHTDCSISVLLDSGIAIVGDILVPSFFTGELCLAYFANNQKALTNSVKKLIDQTDTFYGGHGGLFTKEEVSRLIKS